MSNPKATAAQLEEMLALSDGYKVLDINGRFMVVNESGACLSDRSSASGTLAVLRFLREGFRERQAEVDAAYKSGLDDGYWKAKAEARQLTQELTRA